MCPHILRYLTTAVITNKDVRKRRQVLKDLVKVIQQVPGPQLLKQPNVHDDCSTWRCFSLPQESYTYKDPITEFVECLYVNFDFDGAQKKLRECESVRASFHTRLPAPAVFWQACVGTILRWWNLFFLLFFDCLAFFFKSLVRQLNLSHLLSPLKIHQQLCFSLIFRLQL